MGRFALTLQHSVLFISWLPYSPGTINPVCSHIFSFFLTAILRLLLTAILLPTMCSEVDCLVLLSVSPSPKSSCPKA
jgi:hypothetical protein